MTHSLTVLVVVVLSIATVATALDRVLLERHRELWRRKLTQVWVELNTPESQLGIRVNELFRWLFDVIYGKRAVSWHRVAASILSSFAAMVIITVAIGYERSLWPRLFSATPGGVAVVLLLPVLLNLVPDYFSLIETRLILRWARKSRSLVLLFFICLDIVLTLGIFLGGAFIYYQGLLGRSGGEGFTLWITTFLFRPEGMLIPLLTTFVTSLFWLLFVFTISLVRLSQYLSPVLGFAYYAVIKSNHPVLTLSALVNAFLFVAYSAWVGLAWIVADK